MARRHFAEQHAAFGLRRARGFDQRDGDLIGGRARILDHGLGNVFDQTALLIERAAFQNIDNDFRHELSSIATRPTANTPRSPRYVQTCLEFRHVLSENYGEGTTGANNEVFSICSW